MLFKDYFNDEQSEFGVNLLFALKKLKKDKWNSDWRNEALMGIACDNNYRYEDRYYSFKKAYDLAKSIGEGDHPGLLINLARCHSAPGPLVIPYDKCLELAMRAIKDKLYPDAAWALTGIYSSMGDQESHRKWRAVAEQLEKEGAEMSPHVYPEFLWDKEINSSRTR